MKAAEAHLSLNMSKCHIVGNLIHWLINLLFKYDVVGGKVKDLFQLLTNILLSVLSEKSQSAYYSQGRS